MLLACCFHIMSLSLVPIKQQLEQLNKQMLDAQQRFGFLLENVHPAQYASAVNLLHYLVLRSKDIRELQDALHENGFSSLTNSESHIRSQVLAVLKHLDSHNDNASPDYNASKQLLHQRVDALFGTVAGNAIPAIMVTLKTSHAHDYLVLKKLLRSGMNIARINCAHDNEETWYNMVKGIRKASESTAIPCKIYMDLAGPKIRTVITSRKQRILLEEEDEFYLSDKKKKDLPVVGCSIPNIATQLQRGEKVLFDDGLIEAKVVEANRDAAKLEVIRVSSKKPYLKNEKGINFPDSKLALSALTEYDRKCLPFILKYADMVGYSFVHNTPDLAELQNAMTEKKLPVILKIETPEGFKNLPHLLFKAMEQERYGVMIARGDLAVELGFERISEVQEEILWICDAAHAPVIWATQVLENMNKKGIATRSEVTDAAYGVMAECVMVNKGPHTVQVIKTLKNILQRSGSHRLKKRYLFRPLNVAKEFLFGRV
jgi:pyruvate kinase